MSTNVLRGLDIKIGVIEGDKFTLLAGQRGATLNRSSEAIDGTHKGSNGWKENLAGTKEWSIECNGVFVTDDVAFAKLEQAFAEDMFVKVKISNGTWGYEGQALITDFPIETPYDDAATYTVTLQGSGSLNKIAINTPAQI